MAFQHIFRVNHYDNYQCHIALLVYLVTNPGAAGKGLAIDCAARLALAAQARWFSASGARSQNRRERF